LLCELPFDIRVMEGLVTHEFSDISDEIWLLEPAEKK